VPTRTRKNIQKNTKRKFREEGGLVYATI